MDRNSDQQQNFLNTPWTSIFHMNLKLWENTQLGLLNGKNTNRFLEKNLELIQENHQKTIEYIQDIVQNFQHAWVGFNGEQSIPKKGYRNENEDVDVTNSVKKI